VPPADALALVEARVRPFSVEVVSDALAEMRPAQRKKLVEGTARSVESWVSRARSMPKPMAKAIFGPFCTNATDPVAAAAANESVSTSAQLATKAMVAAVDALRPMDVLEAVIGAERADAAATRVCTTLGEAPLTWAQRVRDSFKGATDSVTAPIRGLLPWRCNATAFCGSTR
jgi:hypothetical protein